MYQQCLGFQDIDVSLLAPPKAHHVSPEPAISRIREHCPLACMLKGQTYVRATVVPAPEQPSQVLRLSARYHGAFHVVDPFTHCRTQRLILQARVTAELLVDGSLADSSQHVFDVLLKRPSLGGTLPGVGCLFFRGVDHLQEVLIPVRLVALHSAMRALGGDAVR